MKIQIKNIGALKQAEFELGDFTIICGTNNTGKTYATYALFGFLTEWRNVLFIKISQQTISQLMEEGIATINLDEYINEAQEILKKGCDSYVKQLTKVFAAPKERFATSKFQVIIDKSDIHPADTFSLRMGAAKTDLFSITKLSGISEITISLLVEKEKLRIPESIVNQVIGDAIKDILFSHLFPKPFIASAERTGAAIFRKELNFARNRLLEKMSQSDKDINPFELLSKGYSGYALPVQSNVDFTRNLETLVAKQSFIKEKYPELLSDFASIIGGDYIVTKNDELFYIPQKQNLKLSMDQSSSGVRSLLDIGFYLRYEAAEGDLLIVDEPELNLHPENQRKVARLFARLVNIGIKVFITTHSDYIIKELNTLLMLKNESTYIKKIIDVEGYKQEELLLPEQLKVYIAEKAPIMLDGGARRTNCQTLTRAEIDDKMGIEAKSFDNTINEMNRIQDEIIFGGDDVILGGDDNAGN